MRWLGKIGLITLASGGSAALALALLVRLTVRDRFALSATFFYATPWPVLAGGSALLAAFWLYRKHRIPGSIHSVIFAVALGAWVSSSWRFHPRPAARGELRVVLWNVSRPERGLPAVARWLGAQDADIIALAEGHHRGKSTLARWQRELPGYEAVELNAEMTCLIRGKILSQEIHPSPTDVRHALLHCEVRGRPVTLLMVDFRVRWRESRGHAFAELAEISRPHLGGNLIVLGDFNTPRESVFFLPMRGEMKHAFEAAGRGIAETWPLPLPMLNLDQIWTSRALRAVHCEHGYSLRSDHRAVIADFDFAARLEEATPLPTR